MVKNILLFVALVGICSWVCCRIGFFEVICASGKPCTIGIVIFLAFISGVVFNGLIIKERLNNGAGEEERKEIEKRKEIKDSISREASIVTVLGIVVAFLAAFFYKPSDPRIISVSVGVAAFAMILFFYGFSLAMRQK